MFDLDKWKEIWATITRNRTRSILTAFGVSWGLFMFILLVGFGNGFKKGVMDNFSGISPNACFFWTNRTSVPFEGYRKGRRWEMNSKDLTLVREKAQSVKYISPMLFSGINTVRGNKTGSYTMMGVFPDQFEIQSMYILHGRLINDIDIAQSRKVCFIGREVYETLFSMGENPVGESIRAGGIYYRVAGVGAPVSPDISIGSNPLQTVYIPFSTMKHTGRWGDVVDLLAVTTKTTYDAEFTELEVKEIIKNNHNIAPEDSKAMGSFNVEKEFRMVENLFTGISVLIWIVGMGALFSGVIGISNIMLVTIRERMREIGIRRAIGAKPFAIISQILSESFVLTSIAGMAGLLAGIGTLTLAQQMITTESKVVIIPFVSFRLALAAVGILVFSGLIAGLMPALKALRIKAIDAIRDE
ncbi:MAG: ABC transporter permease [Bacteroidales bacterium]|jgi:putative ABC transport system permease protein|nr:ABC transporter permease [Bacteroidales bacterium]